MTHLLHEQCDSHIGIKLLGERWYQSFIVVVPLKKSKGQLFSTRPKIHSYQIKGRVNLPFATALLMLSNVVGGIKKLML